MTDARPGTAVFRPGFTSREAIPSDTARFREECRLTRAVFREESRLTREVFREEGRRTRAVLRARTAHLPAGVAEFRREFPEPREAFRALTRKIWIWTAILIGMTIGAGVAIGVILS